MWSILISEDASQFHVHTVSEYEFVLEKLILMYTKQNISQQFVCLHSNHLHEEEGIFGCLFGGR